MSADVKAYEDRMKKSVEVLEKDFAGIRAGRPDPRVLDRIMVDYYGNPTPINQVGNISVEQGKNLLIQPWETNILKAVEKAILTSDLGINPSNDGKVIRLVFPELSEERRKVLSKDIKERGEKAKVALRNIRRDAMEDFKKQQKKSEITEDDLKNLETEIQKLTDKYVKNLDNCVESKNKEIMTV